MKKTAFVLVLVLLASCLAACSEAAPTGSEADYKTVIEDARPAELNDLPLFTITTGPDSEQYEMTFSEANGFVEADMQRYALSVGLIITQAYGVAIALPAEGKQQDVLDQFNAYVEAQRKAQENYLPDQYAIAMAAIVTTAETGEVLMAMCEDSQTVMDNMLAGLKA